MEDAAQGNAEVKYDLASEAGSEQQIDGKPSLPRRKPNKDSAVHLSVKAFNARDRAALAVTQATLDRAGFTDFPELQRYLGGATVRHALVWLALRTQAFTVVD